MACFLTQASLTPRRNYTPLLSFRPIPMGKGGLYPKFTKVEFMSLENLLNRLQKVRRSNSKNGEASYIASCPCHKDNHPSLTITQKQDGVILLHCFSQQCTPVEITAAIGLELGDLFPPKPETHLRQNQRRGGLMFNPFDVLKTLAFDLTQALALFRALQRGEMPTAQDIGQFSGIVGRLHDSLEAIKPTTLRGAK